MNWWQMTVLAFVQGLTEFLPISSSGHLVIVEDLIGVETDIVEVNVLLHAGTLGSILVVYFRSVMRLLSEDDHVIWLLAVGTVPAIVIGLTIQLTCKWLVETPLVAGLMLPVTGAMLLWVARRDGKAEYQKLSYRDAILIGLFQAFALLPGVSRSGATIVAGLLVGLKRPAAATFSFLLAIPAILLATAWETLKLLREAGGGTAPAILAYGAGLSFLVGIFALWCVIHLLNRGRLHWFAWWCIPVGILVIVWQTMELAHAS